MHCSGHAGPWTSWAPAPSLAGHTLARTLAMENPVNIPTVTGHPVQEISFPM